MQMFAMCAAMTGALTFSVQAVQLQHTVVCRIVKLTLPMGFPMLLRRKSSQLICCLMQLILCLNQVRRQLQPIVTCDLRKRVWEQAP